MGHVCVMGRESVTSGNVQFLRDGRRAWWFPHGAGFIKAGDRSRTGDLQLGKHLAKGPIPTESVWFSGVSIRF